MGRIAGAAWQALVLALILAAAARIVKGRLERSGAPKHAVGTVVSSSAEHYEEDGRRVEFYRNFYEFKDDAGRVWRNSTDDIPASLEAGKQVDVTWPEGHPEHGKAKESFRR